MFALALAASLVTIPSGWIDLVGAKADPSPLAQFANSGQFSRFAVSGDRAAFFAVVENPDIGYLDDRALDAIIAGIKSCAVDERGFLRVRGRRTGRIVSTCKHDDEEVREIMYVVPAEGATVSLIYSSTDEKYRGAFEDAAAASIVALNPAWWALSRDEALLFALFVTVSFLLFSAVLLRRRARMRLA